MEVSDISSVSVDAWSMYSVGCCRMCKSNKGNKTEGCCHLERDTGTGRQALFIGLQEHWPGAANAPNGAGGEPTPTGELCMGGGQTGVPVQYTKHSLCRPS